MLWTFGSFCGIFPRRYGMLHHEKSGNPGCKTAFCILSKWFPFAVLNIRHFQFSVKLEKNTFLSKKVIMRPFKGRYLQPWP
jgi:hypothetical protein